MMPNCSEVLKRKENRDPKCAATSNCIRNVVVVITVFWLSKSEVIFKLLFIKRDVMWTSAVLTWQKSSLLL